MMELSIIIPTIGRDTILRTLNSVKHPDIFEYIIVDDSKDGLSKELKSSLVDLVSNKLNLLSTLGCQGPGITKQIGINACKSKYFLILDDDDYLRVGGIETILNILKSFPTNWVSFHWGTKESSTRNPIMRYISAGHLGELLFDFHDYNPEGNFKVVYPGSSVVFRKDVFKEVGINLHHKYADDALAASLLMYRYAGIDILANIGVVGHTEGSVSRGLPNKQDVKDAIEEIINYRNNNAKTTEIPFLDKVLGNIYARLNHIGFKINKDEFAY